MGDAKLRTCARCAHLRRKDVVGMSFAYCGQTKDVVPQYADAETGSIHFWRVPLECPRPDDEVYKRFARALPEHQESINVLEIKK